MSRFWVNCYYVIGFSLLMTACTNNNEYEIVEYEDFIPQAEGDYSYEEDSLLENQQQFTPFQEKLVNVFPQIKFIENGFLEKRKTFFMPNRLGYIKKDESYFKKDSIPFQLIEWTFEDSLKTINAFYNWLDCFGPDCKTLQLNEETKATSIGFVLWVSDTKLSYLASFKAIDEKQWQKKYFKSKESNWNFIIKQFPHSSMKWIISPESKKQKKSNDET